MILTGRREGWKGRGIVLFVSVLLSVRLLFFITEHSVNLLFSDHWTYLRAMFEGGGAWDRFMYQHGPHRQGIGFLISGFLLELSNWNVNVDSYFIGLLLCFSNVLFLSVIKRLRGYFELWDVVFPILILSPIHYETILLAGNSSHSIMPFFLISLVCFLFTLRENIVTNFSLLILGFLLLFTGFGFFAGLILLSYLLFRSSIRVWSRKYEGFDILTILLPVFSFVLYFLTYDVHFATYDFSLKPPTSYEYLEFLSFLWAGVFQVRAPYALSLGLILLSSVFLALFLSVRMRDSNKSMKISIFLLASSLIYSIALTTGRISTGPNFAQGSRYMILATSGILGLYFFVNSLRNQKVSRILAGVLLLLSLNDLFLDKIHSDVLVGFQSIKRNFLSQYSKDKTLEQVQLDAGVIIPGASEERFKWLQERGVHFPEQ
jgi:hypothetical protein